jgi:hypothetical protein
LLLFGEGECESEVEGVLLLAHLGGGEEAQPDSA